MGVSIRCWMLLDWATESFDLDDLSLPLPEVVVVRDSEMLGRRYLVGWWEAWASQQKSSFSKDLLITILTSSFFQSSNFL